LVAGGFHEKNQAILRFQLSFNFEYLLALPYFLQFQLAAPRWSLDKHPLTELTVQCHLLP
jgi:hypothetical protein